MKAFADISSEYSTFQNKNSLSCASGCGKCCFKSDIYCTPLELLPLALDLFERGEAESILEKCLNHEADHCMFMSITDLKAGKGQCTEYEFRPLICRTFGVAGKHAKDRQVSFSVCTTLKETNTKNYSELLTRKFENDDIPFIDKSKNKLSCLDPHFLGEEFPINKALAILLDKLLLEHSFRDNI
jgi:Fe-S-cluster containining protein